MNVNKIVEISFHRILDNNILNHCAKFEENGLKAYGEKLRARF